MKRRVAPFVLSAVTAALFTALVVAAAYLSMGMYPFGKGSVALTDVNQQVIPLLAVFRDICAGRESIFYSFTQGGGMSLYGVFFFFLSSPFSFFSLLFEKADLPLAVNIILALKLILASASGGYACKKLADRLPWQLAALTGAAYGLCGFGLQYYQNILWLDIQILFPLLLVSLHHLLEKGRLLPYTLLLTGMIVISYYQSYMLALFLILFGAGTVLLCRDIPPERLAKLLAGSILAALLSAVCWLPAVLQSAASARSKGLLEKLSGSSFFGPLETKLPIFLSTGLLIALVFLFRARLRELDRVWLILLLLTVLPVVIEPIGRMWEWGDYQCFPVRYGFIPLFLLLLSAGRAIESDALPHRTLPGNIAGACLALAAVAAAMLFYLRFHKGMDAYPATLWGDSTSLARLAGLFCVFAVGYGAVILLWTKRRIVLPVFCACLFVLCGTEGYLNLRIYTGQGLFKTDLERYRAVTDIGAHLPEGEFARVGVEKKTFPSNWLGGAGMPTLGHYTSFTPSENLKLFRTLGYSSNWMELSPGGGTLFSDALLCRGYNLTVQNDHAVYQNERYALTQSAGRFPFAQYIADGAAISLPDGRIAAQEVLFEELFPQAGTLFAEYEPEQETAVTQTGDGVHLSAGATLTYTCEVSGLQALYLDCFSGVNTRISDPVYRSLRVTVNGKTFRREFPTAEENGLLCLGAYRDERVTVILETLKSADCVSFGVYGLRQDAFVRAYGSVSVADVTPGKGTIAGRVESAEPATLLCSVPYDAHFIAEADGRRLETCSVGGFLGIRLPAGAHTLSVRYRPAGFTVGAGLSMIGLLLLAGGILLWLKKPALLKRLFAKTGRAAALFWLIAGGAVLAAVYLGSVVWSLA